MGVGKNQIDVETDSLSHIVVTGDIDFTNAAELQLSVQRAAELGERIICIDLSDAGFLDSSGISILVACRQLAADRGRELQIESASAQILRALQLSGVAGHFELPLLRLESTEAPNCADMPKPGEWDICESVALGEPALIKPLRQVVVDVAREQGIAEDCITDIQLAVGEAISNAVRHGSPRGNESRVRLRCLFCPSAMVVEITDEGEEFDSEHSPVSDQQETLEGGMGIHLMRRAMDEVEYTHIGCGNRVRMVKWIRR